MTDTRSQSPSKVVPSGVVAEEAPVKIRVRDLDFYYDDFNALTDITCDIKAQAVTAFIGPSGCGKSTFLRCFNRMNDLIPGTRVVGTSFWTARTSTDPMWIRSTFVGESA